MKSISILAIFLMTGLLAMGCSQEPELTAPQGHTQNFYDKDGSEGLGAPSIAIASGSGIAQGGVGMFGLAGGAADLEITVPLGATINQVLLYWSGGSTETIGDDPIGDDTIAVNGIDVDGELIGGPTLFYNNYNFFAYRQDITLMGAVVPGDNTVEISGFNFIGDNDENNGATILVIYEDGTAASIELRDGLDLAYFEFAPPLDATVPQTFNFLPEGANRVAELVIFAGSAGLDRPNQIKVTTASGDQVFDNELASVDGNFWDSITLEVDILANEDFLIVEVISVNSLNPQGASLDWVGAGLSVPTSPPVEDGCTLTIGYWKGRTGLGNGNQDDEVSQHLPLTLGDEGGAKSLTVIDNVMALDVLKQRTYGRPNNGITKLYAQLLASKLNFASGASDGAVADYVADADAFLAEHDHDDWGDLTDEEEANVMMWHGAFDDYNNGDIGPGHCEDDDRDDDDHKGKDKFQ